jgi:hypothetical protein
MVDMNHSAPLKRVTRVAVHLLLCSATFLASARPAHGIDVKISTAALDRTLKAQLFTAADGRYYVRGDASSPCFVYADNPHVSFRDDRIIVHVHARAKLGTTVRGSCVGVSMNTEADVSFVPEAEGESIGFRDARIERLSENRELNFLLVPFLSRQLPSHMKVNAADLMRKLLLHSADITGYTLALGSLKLHSMQVQGQSLTLDLDANLSVD